MFVALPWGDDVEVRRTDDAGIRLRVEGDPVVPRGPENLAARAAETYLSACSAPVAGGVSILLRKRIPVGAGLGGGSSDAAAVLRALDREIGDVDGARLGDLAATLGSDVPFFLRAGASGAAIGRGRGERIEVLPARPASSDPACLLLMMPTLVNETARVYERWHATDVGLTDGLSAAVAAWVEGDTAALRAAHRNALAEPARRAYPAFDRFVAEVEQRTGRTPCVSGTGSTLFEVCSREQGEELRRSLEDLPAQIVLLPMGVESDPSGLSA